MIFDDKIAEYWDEIYGKSTDIEKFWEEYVHETQEEHNLRKET